MASNLSYKFPEEYAGQVFFTSDTHFFHKNILKYNTDERRSFIRRCMKRLAGEFPEMYRIAAGLEEFEDYM